MICVYAPNSAISSRNLKCETYLALVLTSGTRFWIETGTVTRNTRMRTWKRIRTRLGLELELGIGLGTGTKDFSLD